MGNKVRVQEFKNKQFVVTIPRTLAEALGVTKGKEMEWTLQDGKLTLSEVQHGSYG